MTKILVLYYSSYGHTATLAESIAEGARGAGADVDVRRVRETAPPEVAKRAGFVTDDRHPAIDGPDALRDYDAILVGSPTRYGRISSQMASFWDTTGGLWQEGALVGKVGGAFASTASQHGGQETTLFSILTNLLHMGMTIVPMDYGYQGLLSLDEVSGGTPYGPTTIAGGDGSRQPSENELGGCRYFGEKVARATAKLSD